MSDQRTVIDGVEIDVQTGETILDACVRIGVDVPTLCHVEGLPPEGGCRLCLVEIEGRHRPAGACHTAITPGMRVRTDTPALNALRRDILELIVAACPSGRFHAGDDGDEMGRLMSRLGVGTPGASATPPPPPTPPPPLDDSHPYLRFDAGQCVECRRCLNVCEGIQGQFVYGVANRGASTRLIFGPSDNFADTPCTACGECVDHCPTDALTDRDRHGPELPASTIPSVCGYCGVGCRIAVDVDDNRVTRIDGVADAAVNRGHLCVKGRYAHAWHHSGDRLTTPLLRDGDDWRLIDWPEAIQWLAGRLAEIRDEHGPDALGVMTSSRSTNEAAYLLQKLFRTRIGTNNVDCCARVCHSSTALGLQLVTGTGAASASYDDIEKARCIVVAGANPTEAHPVVARVKQAALRGTPLIVIDPRRIELAEYADLHLPLHPGTNVALFNGLARALLDEQLIDTDYVQQRTEGCEALAEFLERCSLSDVARITGVEPDLIVEAARRMGRCGGALFVTGLGLSETTQGTASVMTICNLAMLTGSVGRPGAGMLPLRGQNNVQGNADMGGMPNQVTGYQPLDDEQVRARLQREWGKTPPVEPGKTIPEMINAAADRRIRGLWIQGEDVAQSDPNQSHVLAALEALDLLVVQEIFFSETARYAHLVLPAAGALEQDGTFTNGERRIQRVRVAVTPPGQARPDWEAIRDVANAMGERWSYDTPAEVMEEIARVAPRLFGGVRYERLDPDGLQWPCPEIDHPGTATVHADGFLRGKGQLVVADFTPSPEHGVEGFPYVLITGRVLEHYNVGTMTRRSPARDWVPADVLELHPADAEAEHIEDGERIVIESRWGTTSAPVALSRRVTPGTLFLSFHFPETHTNRLVGPHLDPQSHCPEYKVTAVRLRRETPVA